MFCVYQDICGTFRWSCSPRWTSCRIKGNSWTFYCGDETVKWLFCPCARKVRKRLEILLIKSKSNCNLYQRLKLRYFIFTYILLDLLVEYFHFSNPCWIACQKKHTLYCLLQVCMPVSQEVLHKSQYRFKYWFLMNLYFDIWYNSKRNSLMVPSFLQ